MSRNSSVDITFGLTTYGRRSQRGPRFKRKNEKANQAKSDRATSCIVWVNHQKLHSFIHSFASFTNITNIITTTATTTND